MAEQKTVAVDLDGVLARYKEWEGIKVFGKSVPGARGFLQALKNMGLRVVIHTVRCNPESAGGGDPEALAAWVEGWLRRRALPYDEIFIGVGKPLAAAYIDDRAVICQPQKFDFAYELALRRVRELVSG